MKAAEQKKMRKEREQELEDQLARLLTDPEADFSDRATQGFTMLANKLADDLTTQLSHVEELKASDEGASFVDAEIQRLLRMLERRKKMFEEVEEAIAQASLQSFAVKSP